MKLLWVDDVYNPFILERTISVDGVRAKMLADCATTLAMFVASVLFTLFVVQQIRCNKDSTLYIFNNKVSLRLFIRSLILILALYFSTFGYLMEVVKVVWDIRDTAYSGDYKRSVVALFFVLSCLYKPSDIIHFKQRLTNTYFKPGTQAQPGQPEDSTLTSSAKEYGAASSRAR